MRVFKKELCFVCDSFVFVELPSNEINGLRKGRKIGAGKCETLAKKDKLMTQENRFRPDHVFMH